MWRDMWGVINNALSYLTDVMCKVIMLLLNCRLLLRDTIKYLFNAQYFIAVLFV